MDAARFIPLNLRIMAQPANWIIVTLMVLIASYAFVVIGQFAHQQKDA